MYSPDTFDDVGLVTGSPDGSMKKCGGKEGIPKDTCLVLSSPFVVAGVRISTLALRVSILWSVVSLLQDRGKGQDIFGDSCTFLLLKHL